MDKTTPTVPQYLFAPAANLLQIHTSSLSLFGYFPQNLTPPYLYMPACFSVTATYPYRYSQEGCSGYGLLFTQTGQGVLILGTESIPLPQQTFFFWPCSQGFSFRAVSSHWNHYFLFLDGREANCFYSLFVDNGNHPWPVPTSSCLPNLLSSLSRKDSTAYASFLEQLFLSTSLMTEALGICQKKEENTFCPEYLLAVRRMLDEEYNLPCSLDLLEKRFRVSKFRIVREFSQHFHQSPISYLNKRRLEAAKNLLVTTEEKINEISQKTGFGSSNLFIRSFKKETGVTPQKYRTENSKIR